MLQWDRASDGAEMWANRSIWPTSISFNGTAPVMARKWGWEDHGQSVDIMLQWDRASDGAEMSTSVHRGRLSAWRFNGTAPVMARKSYKQYAIEPLACASMGPRQ